MALKQERHKKPRPPLDEEALERLALFYAGRYASTRARLGSYLGRKLKERGWAGEGAPPIERVVERFSALGYVDDKAFASARAASLQRRGFGARRIDQALRAAGIDEEDGADARDLASEGAWEAALRFAERKRIGPFAPAEPSREGRHKAFAAMMRAGHPPDLVRRLLSVPHGEVPDADSA